jgi:hypothetical protein
MNIESQVCSLELSKRLKELGVKQESLFYWCYIIKDEKFVLAIQYDILHLHKNNEYEDLVVQVADEHPDYSDEVLKEHISAFTVAELGEILPRYVKLNQCEFYYTQIPSQHLDKWLIFYRSAFNSWTGQDQEDENEANARAKMLIYLLENKLMELPNE